MSTEAVKSQVIVIPVEKYEEKPPTQPVSGVVKVKSLKLSANRTEIYVSEDVEFTVDIYLERPIPNGASAEAEILLRAIGPEGNEWTLGKMKVKFTGGQSWARTAYQINLTTAGDWIIWAETDDYIKYTGAATASGVLRW